MKQGALPRFAQMVVPIIKGKPDTEIVMFLVFWHCKGNSLFFILSFHSLVSYVQIYLKLGTCSIHGPLSRNHV